MLVLAPTIFPQLILDWVDCPFTKEINQKFFLSLPMVFCQLYKPVNCKPSAVTTKPQPLKA